MTKVGELVGRGRTSDVYAYGRDSVLKVPHIDVPGDWPEFEALLTKAVGAKGVAAPEMRDIVEYEDRIAVVFERIDGQSMWQQMLDRPSDVSALTRDLADIQRALFTVGIPERIPELVDRLTRKIAVAARLSDTDKAEALAMTASLPRGAALLHGDLHPGNVLMSSTGPVVIDWFDATIGHPVADVLRSSLLMQPVADSSPWHLPGASPEVLSDMHRTYLQAFSHELEFARSDLGCWRAVLAAARLAEGAEVNEDALVALWQSRHDDNIADSLIVS